MTPAPAGHHDPRLPNLMIPGVQKAGTTALFRLLIAHAEVTGPPGKEPHVFSSRDWRERMGRYGSRESGEARYRLDASTSYFFSEVALRRIGKHVHADAKLVVSLRAPAERALSAYYQVRGKKVFGTRRWYEERAPEACFELEAASAAELREAEAEELRRAADAGEIRLEPYREFEDPFWPYRYLSNSLYSDRVALLVELFPRDQILFLEHRELLERPGEVAARLFRFLDLEPCSPEILARRSNVTVVPRRGPVRDLVHLGYPYLRKALGGTRALEPLYRKAFWGPPTRRRLELSGGLRPVFGRDLERVAGMTGVEVPLE